MLASDILRRLRRVGGHRSPNPASLPLWARVNVVNVVGAIVVFVLAGYFFEGVTEGKISDFARRADYDLQEKTLENEILGARLASIEGKIDSGEYAPGPGLHVEVLDKDWRLLWSSSPDRRIAFDRQAASPDIGYPRGETIFEQFEMRSGEERFALATYVGTCGEDSGPCIFRASKRMQRISGEAGSHAALPLWIILAFLVVFLAQMFFIHRTFAPVKRLSGEIREIGAAHEGGSPDGVGPDRVSGRYPADIQILADRLNDLIDEDRRKITEARETLENLSHDLNHLARSGGNVESAFRNVLNAYIRVFVRFSETIPPHVDVQRLVRTCRAGFVELYADRPIPLDIDIDVDEGAARVRADEGVLELVLTNLMSNACKFADRQVRIRAAVGEKQPTTLVLVVEDDGPGAPSEEEVEVALRRGGQVDPDREGMGLGLSNIRRMVELLSGTLHIDGSDNLGGWRVRVTLDWWLRSRMGGRRRPALRSKR